VDFGEASGTLKLRIRDKADGQLATARVSVKQKGGKFHAPVGAMYRLLAGLGHFYCRGETSIDLPVGSYEVIAFRGPEYRMVHLDLEIKAGATAEAQVDLERWVNAASEDWYSGENHIHANYGYGAWYNSPRTIFDQCEGEDLNVANLVAANSDGDGVFDREFFRGGLDPLSTARHLMWWNEEFRSTIWGHMTLFHLHSLVEPVFTGFKDTTNPWDVPDNLQIAQRTHLQGGIASYTHPAASALDLYTWPYTAKGLPADVVTGDIDMLDVMCMNYDQSLLLWYRLLNCGFHLPAAAGTDVFLNRVTAYPPGWARAYVHVPGGLTYDKWVAGLRAGRAFVTNGPMIELTVNDQPMGSIISLDAPGKVHVKGRVRSQHPLSLFEVIKDGETLSKAALENDHTTGNVDAEVMVEHSGWIALRASGPVNPYWPSPYGSRAHTNPVYVEVKGHPRDASEQAAYFLKWIDRLEDDLKRRGQIPEAEWDHVRTHLLIARNAYRALLPKKAAGAN
jgi:hypothetical protein